MSFEEICPISCAEFDAVVADLARGKQRQAGAAAATATTTASAAAAPAPHPPILPPLPPARRLLLRARYRLRLAACHPWAARAGLAATLINTAALAAEHHGMRREAALALGGTSTSRARPPLR